MALTPGTVIDRYTVDSVLGQGGMAVVYKVKHNQLGSWHALKVLTIASDAIRQRLVQEGRVQATLAHPNIVAVTDILDVNGQPGLVMEFITGSSLDHLIAENKPAADESERLFRGIVSGVQHAHALGVVHRDLKPANVMLFTGGGQTIPKVADFGLAKAVADESAGGMGQTRSGVAMGTPAYMAPEQIRDAKNVDARADVFSLGCILYELFTGRPPFQGPDLLTIFNLVASGEYAPIQSVVPDVPTQIKNTIEGCIQVDRDRRLQDCAALLEVLDGKPWQLVAPAAPAMGQTWMGEEQTGSNAALGSVAMSQVPADGQQDAAGTGTLAPNTQGEVDNTGSLKPVSSPSLAGTAAKGGLAVMGIGGLAVGVGALALLVIGGAGGGWMYMQSSANARMTKFLKLRTGGEVTFATCRWRPGGIVLGGVRVYGSDSQPVAAIGRVRLQGSWGGGEWQLDRVELHDFQGDLRRDDDGWVVPTTTAALLTGNIKSRDAGFVINATEVLVPNGLVKYRGAKQDLELSWDDMRFGDFTVSARDPAGWDAKTATLTGFEVESDNPLAKVPKLEMADGVVTATDAEIWTRTDSTGWLDLPEALRWQVVDFAGGYRKAPIREPWFGLDATWMPGSPSQLKFVHAVVHHVDSYAAYPPKEWEVVLDSANLGPVTGDRMPFSASGRTEEASVSLEGDLRVDGLIRGRAGVRNLDVSRVSAYFAPSTKGYGVSVEGGVLTADLAYSLMGPAFTGAIEGTVGSPRLAVLPGEKENYRTRRLTSDRAAAQVGDDITGSLSSRRFGVVDGIAGSVGDALFDPAGGAIRMKRK